LQAFASRGRGRDVVPATLCHGGPTVDGICHRGYPHAAEDRPSVDLGGAVRVDDDRPVRVRVLLSKTVDSDFIAAGRAAEVVRVVLLLRNGCTVR
jgi:hypothetical protein